MQFTFGDKREVYLLDESALPLNKKESMREGKRRMKYGHASLSSFNPNTNEQVGYSTSHVIKKHKYTTDTFCLFGERPPN